MRKLLAAGVALAALAIAAPAAAQLTLTGAGGGVPGVGGGGGPVPVLNWVNAGTIPTSSTTATTDKGANSIATGSLSIIGVLMSDNSGTNHSIQCPATGGWTAFTWSPRYDGSGGFNQAACWRIEPGGATGAYALTWTTTNSQSAQWVLINISGANATAPIEDTAITQSYTTAVSTPSVNSAGANRLFFSCSSSVGSSINWTASPGDMTVPTGFPANTGALVKQACATKTVAAGATGPRAWTKNAANPSFDFSYLIKP